MSNEEQNKQITGKRRTKKASTTNCVSADTGELHVCNVCCAPYTNVKRKQIKCLYCGYDVCNTCLQQYLLSKGDSHCMNCKKVWCKDFLKNHFPKAFVFDRLQEHYIDVLIQLETSLFPETMTYVEARQAEERARQLEPIAQFCLTNARTIERLLALYTSGDYLKTKSISLGLNQILFNFSPTLDVEKSKNFLETVYTNFPQLFGNIEIQANINIKECVLFRAILYRFIFDNLKLILPSLTADDNIKMLQQVQLKIQSFINTVLHSTTAVNTAEKKKLTRCTTEKCPSYFMCEDTKHKNVGMCKVCQNTSCIDCLTKLSHEEIKDPSKHKCDPSLVATVKFLKESTVPCPNCKTSVSKINGCDQMFCTSCNTAFDWKTGQVMTGNIHNPHYFEYLAKNKGKQQPQQPRDCEQILLSDELYSQLDRMLVFALKHHVKNLQFIRSFWYMTVDFQRREIADFANIDRNVISRYRRLRVDFLSGVYNKDEWRRRLKVHHLENNYKLEKTQLQEAVVLIAHNIFMNFVEQMREVYRLMKEVGGINAPTPPEYETESEEEDSDDEDVEQDDNYPDPTDVYVKQVSLETHSLQRGLEQEQKPQGDTLYNCKINSIVSNALDSIKDLVKYYNNHMRVIDQDQGHTTYRKMVEYFDSYSNLTCYNLKSVKITNNELDVDIQSLKITDISDEILTEQEVEIKKMLKAFYDAHKKVADVMQLSSYRKFSSTHYLINEDSQKIKELLNILNDALDEGKVKAKFDLIVMNNKKKSNKDRKDVIRKAVKEFEQIYHIVEEDKETLEYHGNLIYTVNNFILKDKGKLDKWYGYFNDTNNARYAYNKNRFNALLNHYTGDQKFLAWNFKPTDANLASVSKEVIVKAFILSIISRKLEVERNPDLS